MGADYGLKGHVAIVTGSTSGIGQALAHALAAEGVDVVLNGFGDAAAIEKDRAALAERAGVRVAYNSADMTKPDEIAAMVEFAQSQFGRLDILINNAGVQFVSPIEDFPIAKWDQIIAINLTSAFHAIRAAVPIMKAQKRGRIINIASAHGLVASPFKSAYVAAKHGIVGLTKTVALEVATSGITCNAICPGYVKTPLVEAQIADQAKARNMTPEQVMKDVILAAQPTKEFVEFGQLAGLMLYLASDMGASANGAALAIDGGWTAE
jgi:3-hydroxybutyrate dehydrogenase